MCECVHVGMCACGMSACGTCACGMSQSVIACVWVRVRVVGA